MPFSSQVPLSSLIDLCHVLRHNLDAGLTLVRVFEQQAARGSDAVRPLATRVASILKRGHGLEAALDDEKDHLPPLFIALVAVGERTGTLPEVFGALEGFYRTQLRLRREFRSRIMMPAMQLLSAILVIAALIFILGLIADSNNTKPLDPLGVGLTGTSGAITFLCLAFGTLGTLIGGYWIAGRKLSQRAAIDRFLLGVPALGPCLYALALSRFCMALRVTLETALPIGEALRLALRATGNAAFAQATEVVERRIGTGKGLTETLVQTGLFDADFQAVLGTAEESGRLPEVMRQQAKYYEEVGEHRMVLLTRVAAFAVWACVAVLIIIAIFRIFNIYLRAIGG